MLAARLGEIPSRSDTQFDAQMLKQNRHEVRDHDHRQQRIAELRATSQVRGPVARIHVAYRHKKTWPRKSDQLSPKRGRHRNDYGAMHFRQ